ncbi:MULTISPECIES: GAP family protein [unclassified Mycobacterium]|uniref:GAP family protein n=1 Tax=unclassified Mycobacterium TaxID=2642494 RepID=UPI0029C94965|nr:MULTISPECIES: GAP family protein [unclassified Mycobacterium]
MGNAIGELLPLAVALAVGPLPIIAIMLILTSEGARSKGMAFAGGRLVGLILLVSAALVIFSAINDPTLGHRGHPSPVVSILRIVVGVVLIGLAARMWRRRGAESNGQPSRLVRRVDGLTVRGSFGMGLAVTAIDPASISIGILVGLDIASVRLPVLADVLFVVVFVLAATVTVTGPVLAYLAGGEAAQRRLTGLKGWLLANEKTVMMVLFVLIGALLIGRGIRELAG